ncbi:MAG: formyltransferase family protein [Verrucomicrobium sp.]|nr:formyltransferase family protein [Verrucomicrobium sp.]
MKPAKKRFVALTLIGPDRKGVIARFTQLLFRLGANIEGLEEQVARSQFRMAVLASWEGKAARDFNAEAVRLALQVEAQAVGMECSLRFEQGGPRRFALLATKEPHAVEAFLKATLGKKPTLPAVPVVLIANRPDLKPLAEKAGIPFHEVDYRDRARAEKEILGLLDQYQVEFAVLARFMKILSPDFVWRWKNKIINIHPSLLPAFPGANAYRQAFEKGVQVFGVTAHFVTPQLDEGPILAQESARLKMGEPLASIVRRGQALEAKCLLRAVKLFLTKKLDVHWGRVHGAS